MLLSVSEPITSQLASCSIFVQSVSNKLQATDMSLCMLFVAAGRGMDGKVDSEVVCSVIEFVLTSSEPMLIA